MKKPSHTTGTLYARVALNIPLEKTFEYEIPNSMKEDIRPGTLVKVPLGKRRVNGCVLDIQPQKSFPYAVKPIDAILSPGYRVEPTLLALAKWLSDYYYCPIGEAVNCVSFIGFNDVKPREEKVVFIAIDENILRDTKLTPKQQQVVDYLIENDNEPMPPITIEQDLHITRAVINNLLKKDILAETTQTVSRTDEYDTSEQLSTPLTLTPVQQKAFDIITASTDADESGVFLLFGITGSGKTEVYLQVIEHVMKEGKGAIVLVPEISLTPQTVERFRNRFGSRVGVYHSRMTLGQKFDLWQQIREGTVSIVIGARSAVFAPIPNLGAIVIDEEQVSTYKQDTAPRYHARHVAIKRAENEDAVVILGSATPGIDSFYHAREGDYTLLRLPERINKLPLPEVELIDMGKEIKETRKHSLISKKMITAINESLERNEQVIILLNRRGYANFVLCHSCRTPIRCPRCDVTMTYHKTRNILVCHYCNKKLPVPEKCPKCGSEHIGLMGMGTQRIEEELGKKFAGHHIVRLDMDTTRNRFELIKRWEEISNGTAEIILGTQMVAKGFDLEHVTLVGVISADMSLFLPDFRAGEQTFSLLTQAAGRAGRSWRGGKVIIQTFQPEYYAIKEATRQDYESFAQKELAIRKSMRFPPFAHLASVLMASEKYDIVREQVEKLGNILKTITYQAAFKNIDIIGPAPAVIRRLRGKFRWRVLLRGDDPELLTALLKYAMRQYHDLRPRRKVGITVEIDPLDLM